VYLALLRELHAAQRNYKDALREHNIEWVEYKSKANELMFILSVEYGVEFPETMLLQRKRRN
jgi:hypothetical protein